MIWKWRIQDYDAAIELDSGNNDALRSRGQLYSEIGEPEKALADLNNAIVKDPKDVEAILARGLVQYNLLHYDEAIKDYSVVLQQGENAERIATVGGPIQRKGSWTRPWTTSPRPSNETTARIPSPAWPAAESTAARTTGKRPSPSTARSLRSTRKTERRGAAATRALLKAAHPTGQSPI